jgi:hypothetical protein
MFSDHKYMLVSQMEVDFKVSMDKMGRNVCTIEDKNIYVQIIFKKNYSDIEEKLREIHILQDIENALDTAIETNEFKDLVDSYGYLYVDNLND